jgi:uncharacterized protein (TIGR00725 family)
LTLSDEALNYLIDLRQQPKIGVIGSARLPTSEEDSQPLIELATRLGKAIAERKCVLVTGATTGFPHLISCAARERGGLSIGISPAMSKDEHVSQYSLPDNGVDVLIYTGFGLKGRNVINVRSCDIVIIFGGELGTLNEFTIAYDEGKVIGVLEGTGGVAEHIIEISKLSSRRGSGEIVCEKEPETLINCCLTAFHKRGILATP